jgi:hypothetical protein
MTRPETAQAPAKMSPYLALVEPRAKSSSDLAPGVERVTQLYLHSGDISFGLDLMRASNTSQIADYAGNAALLTLEDGSLPSGFNDTTSGGDDRTLEDYQDGIKINEDQQPVMAIVALDPSHLSQITFEEGEKASLLEEVSTKIQTVLSDKKDFEIGGRLEEILSTCLLANDTITPQDKKDDRTLPGEWTLPFDKIASLKALYVLLSGEDNSGAARQGALRLEAENGREIIVAGSGYNSAIDEVVARNFGEAVIEEYVKGPELCDEVVTYKNSKGKVITRAAVYDAPGKTVALEATGQPRDREHLPAPAAIIRLEDEHGRITEVGWYDGTLIPSIEDQILPLQKTPLSITVGEKLTVVDGESKSIIIPGGKIRGVAVKVEGGSKAYTPSETSFRRRQTNEPAPFDALERKAKRLLGEASAQQR